MPKKRPTTVGKKKFSKPFGRRVVRPLLRTVPRLAGRGLQTPAHTGDIERMRAEADQAVAEARRAHERLREAIDLLPEGIVFLDSEGRYILWNKKYADIYRRSADLFRPGARLEDTLRIGVERGDYVEAQGREEEWLAERLEKLQHPDGRHEQVLADGRCILIEE